MCSVTTEACTYLLPGGLVPQMQCGGVPVDGQHDAGAARARQQRAQLVRTDLAALWLTLDKKKLWIKISKCHVRWVKRN